MAVSAVSCGRVGAVDDSSRGGSRGSSERGVPRHVAIIMDGNGRWARTRGLTRSEGHRAGARNARRVVEAFANAGVKYLTLYAFSTENWTRPTDEVDALISIIEESIGTESGSLSDLGVRIRHIGSLNRLPADLREAIEGCVEMTRDNDRLTLCVAFNYGSRSEIVEAARALLREGANPEALDEAAFADRLQTAGIPDPDLIVRTAGEMRLSNFLLWQAAYAEFYSAPTLWPDFDASEAEKAIEAYRKRERRFGGLG